MNELRITICCKYTWYYHAQHALETATPLPSDTPRFKEGEKVYLGSLWANYLVGRPILALHAGHEVGLIFFSTRVETELEW